jgi:antitoxin (DNA-binding transcriptional repressor) of toxin-antitoxin stability system
MQHIDVQELATQLPALLAAMNQGAEVIITQANQPVARLIKIEASPPD